MAATVFFLSLDTRANDLGDDPVRTDSSLFFIFALILEDLILRERTRCRVWPLERIIFGFLPF